MDARAQRASRRAASKQLDADRQASGRNNSWPRRIRRLRRRIGDQLVRWFAPLLLRLLASSWRIEIRGEAGRAVFNANAPCILVLWHGRMLVHMALPGHRGRGIGVLVSPSDDGSLAARALRFFGYQVIRGSSSRQGSRALRELTEAVLAGTKVVLTPDGPRGPRHAMNVGGAWLARETGAPVVGVATAVNRAWRLRSWDACTIPKPFARLVIQFLDPIQVAADTADAELEQLSSKLREDLLAAELAGFAALATPPDFAAVAH